jgi:hypothetical protein
MSMIDRQRVAAVRKLEAMGYTFAAGDWMQPANDTAVPAITDALHALLVKRADAIAMRLMKALPRRQSLPISPTQSKPTKRCAGRTVKQLAARVSVLADFA